MRKIAYIFLLSLVFLFGFLKPARVEEKVRLNLFWSEGCPHCRAEKAFLEQALNSNEWLEVASFEISKNRENAALFSQLAKELNTTAAGVPFGVVCDKYVVGFSDTDDYKQKFISSLASYKNGKCVDVVGAFYRGEVEFLQPAEITEPVKVEEVEEINNGLMPETVDLPIWGEVEIKNLSLPVMTFVIALLDGFNPCAMWVLIFLISLLLGMHDRAKMWILGSVFIGTSGLIYFLFLAAWLNLFILLEYIGWVRALIGFVALGTGLYYLRDYQTNKSGGCKVTGGEERKAVFEKLKKVTQNRNFAVSIIGIMMLAVAVNAVELLCSAGLPAIYTQVLAITEMPKWQYYLYLVFYIFIFMLDDLVVFFVAMITLQSTAISGKYARIGHLIGGLVMLVIGILLLVKPELLMFG